MSRKNAKLKKEREIERERENTSTWRMIIETSNAIAETVQLYNYPHMNKQTNDN